VFTKTSPQPLTPRASVKLAGRPVARTRLGRAGNHAWHAAPLLKDRPRSGP